MAITETRKELISKFYELVEDYHQGRIDLNTWEETFLDSIETDLMAEDGFLTERQIEKLEEVYNKYCN